MTAREGKSRPSYTAIVKELSGERATLRPLAARDAPALRAIVAKPEVAAWWGPQDAGFPLEDEPDATRFSVVVNGQLIGLIQFIEELDRDYRHAAIDIFLDPAHHARGLGTDAVATLVRHLIEDRGHHRITIDPAADNVPAIRSYEKAGFQPVGVMRSSWRDPQGRWRDTLLMELVVAPEEEPEGRRSGRAGEGGP